MEDFGAYMDAFDQEMTREPLCTVAGRMYTVRSLLHEGSMCQAFLVGNEAGDTFVLKIGRDYRRQLLRNEYALLSGLKDACFPRVKAIEEQGNRTLLLREYVPGKTLAAYAEEHKLTPSEIVRWTMRACDIISKLHRQTPAIVHRDIKPQNFIVTPENRLVLIDLDSCQRIDPIKDADTQLLGTLTIAAPEQFGARRSDTRTDVFGIGMLSLYLMTNDVRVDGLQACDAPLWLKQIIRRCTLFDPDRRYASIEQLYRALHRAQHRLRKWVLLAVALLLAGGIAMQVKQAQDQRAAELARSDAQQVYINVPLIAQAVAYRLGAPWSTSAFLRGDLRKVDALMIGGDVPYDVWGDVAYRVQEKTLFTQLGQRVDGGPIRYVDDLRQLPNLKQLSLYKQRISDISPLKGLSLTHLALAENPIADFSVLSSLQDLVFLDVCATNIADVFALTGCAKLASVRLLDTDVTDITPLATLPIEELHLDYASLGGGPAALMQFPALTRLCLAHAPIGTLPSIARFTQLQSLALPQYEGYSLDIFRDMQALRALDVSGGKLESLDGAEKLTALRTLIIDGNAVSDLSPLFALPQLEELDIAHTAVTDYRQLLQIPSLKRLTVDRTQSLYIRKGGAQWPFDIATIP